MLTKCFVLADGTYTTGRFWSLAALQENLTKSDSFSRKQFFPGLLGVELYAETSWSEAFKASKPRKRCPWTCLTRAAWWFWTIRGKRRYSDLALRIARRDAAFGGWVRTISRGGALCLCMVPPYDSGFHLTSLSGLGVHLSVPHRHCG